MSNETRAAIAIQRLEFARAYTNDLLKTFGPDDWFRMPHEGVTHAAWQMAHLAAAEYALGIMRLRPLTPADEELVPAGFLEKYGKGSQPDPDPQGNFPLEQIRSIFDGVHRKVITEARTYSPEQLAEEVLRPHQLFKDKLGSLEFAAPHELIHAGQIALLRRLLGKEPLR